MPTFTQLLLRPQPTARTIGTGVGGVHFDITASGTCSLDSQHRAKMAPRGIRNAFAQTTVLLHSFHVQLLHRNRIKPIDNFSAFLMHKVMATIANPFMDARHHFTRFTTCGRALLKLAQASLRLGQSLFVGAIKARVLDLRTIGERGEARQPHVNPDRFIRRGQNLVSAFNGKARIPLSVLESYRASFDFALNGAMNNRFDNADFGQLDRVAL